MLFWLFAGLWILLAFAAGSIPCGWLIARAAGVDITQHGSGNIGGTNVWRIMGWKAGVLCLALDILKGLLPMLALGPCLAAQPAGYVAEGWAHPLKMLVALSAVLGHTFTPWLKFRGGKGAATGLGVIIGLYQIWVLPVLGIFALALLTTRIVSVGSLLAALFLMLFSFSIDSIRPLWPFSVLAFLLVVWTHRTNIRRLLEGKENQIGTGRPPGVKTSPQPEAEAETGKDSCA